MIISDVNYSLVQENLHFRRKIIYYVKYDFTANFKKLSGKFSITFFSAATIFYNCIALSS